MAFEQPGYSIGTFKAGADLSAKQYYAVKYSAADTVILTAAAGTEVNAIGILQNKPADTQAATVMVAGVSKAIAGAAITVGTLVMADNGGKVIAATTGTKALGLALVAATADGDVISVLIGSGIGHVAGTI